MNDDEHSSDSIAQTYRVIHVIRVRLFHKSVLSDFSHFELLMYQNYNKQASEERLPSTQKYSDLLWIVFMCIGTHLHCP